METWGSPRASVKGSDEFHLFTCSPCSRREIDKGAKVYCVQCEEYLCGTCQDDHNKFAKMATHTMLDTAQMEGKDSQPPQPLQTDEPLMAVPCDLHSGQVCTLFCGEHNQVCCVVCSRINHSSCEIGYILDVAKKAMHGSELDEFRQAVKATQINLENVKKQRELDMQRMTTEKDTEINKLHVIVQKIIKHMEVLEKSAADDITRKFTELTTAIGDDLSNLDAIINTLDTKLDKMEKANDDVDKFVHMKMCDEEKCSARILIETIESRAGDEKILFVVDERVAEFYRKLSSLGQPAPDYRHAATPEGHHSVDFKKDKSSANTIGMCLADDGGLLITDWNNECLKRLDQSYQVLDRLKLGGKPHGICPVSMNQYAVCMCTLKSIQLVELKPSKSAMSKSGWFMTTDHCRGIAYHADHLYVTCGGGEGDGPGHISVYTISGTLIRKFERDTRGNLFSSNPLGVVVRNDDVILVCDRDFGLLVLSPSGQRLRTLTCKDLKVNKVNMISMDSHGQALVSSWRSNKVVLISRDTRVLGNVLTAQDGVDKPNALCYDTQQSLLTVGIQESNQFSVFKLT